MGVEYLGDEMNRRPYLDEIVRAQKSGVTRGIPSICSAHPLVLEASLKQGLALGVPVLIESTCNQVNQYGGYTGMKPADFAAFIYQMAHELDFPRERLLLGGDHLGPLVWQAEPARSAMDKAKILVQAAVRAGYAKIHLDASMPCADDKNLNVETIARRTADLAAAAETALPEGALHIRYVIGTEVPAAGGERAGAVGMVVTRVEDAAETISVTRKAFHLIGMDAAWERVMAVVVQPGVEFGDQAIHEYDRASARGLTDFIAGVPGLVYEAHSSDYQTQRALCEMVEDHFAVLKVGPALTFAYREGIFALAEFEDILCAAKKGSQIREALEEAMTNRPGHWQSHYSGTVEAQKIGRKYSLSDRVRYYWNEQGVRAAVERLISNLEEVAIPISLVSQYLPRQYLRVREGAIPLKPHALLLDKVGDVLEAYQSACRD
jgi:D-tagatose-1,6-bisphosphate aldolase subunit GatZ/KbaZ